MKAVRDKKFIISIIILMGGQSFLFWLLKFFQTSPHYFNFVIDNKIPFLPEFVYIYNIFYPLIFVIYLILFNKDRDNYYEGIIAGTIGYIISDIIFILFPTQIIRYTIPDRISKITTFVLNTTYLYDDPPLNCFPSIHCLFCFQAMFNVIRAKNLNKSTKTLIVIILILIIASTVLIKQHYFIDVIGAFVIFIISNLITIKLNLKEKIGVN